MDSKSLAPVGSFRLSQGNYSYDGLRSVLYEVMEELLNQAENPLLLLSGGVDSAVLAKIMMDITSGKMICFTIGGSWNHPDMMAATKLSESFSFTHIRTVPSEEDIERATEALEATDIKVYPGDVGVFLALEKVASFGFTDIIAGDGIDEQVGGYWWHANPDKPLEDVFIDFWNKLDAEHLGPMAHSAEMANVTVHWPYMNERIIKYISRVPLEKRVEDGQAKSWWKCFGKYLDLPEWITERPKQGFIDALNN